MATEVVLVVVVVVVVVLVVLVVVKPLGMRVCPRHHSLIVQGSPRQRRTLRHRGLQKLALNSGTTGGARKKASMPPKKPLPLPFIAAITAKPSTCLCCELECLR